MAVKFLYSMSAVFMTVLLTSCASDPSKEFSYDYTSAETGTFDGFWEGRVDCRYSNGFEPRLWVNISNARGELAFGNRNAVAGSGFKLEGSLYADLDPQNGKIRWGGSIQPYRTTGKQPVSFKGQWMQDKFYLQGRIDQKGCSGVINKKS